MGFSSGQVHYGFIETKKKMTVERLGVKGFIPNFIPMVAGRSPESCPLRVSLHTARRCLPLGLSTPVAIPVSVLSADTTPVSAHLQLHSLAAVLLCRPEHWVELSNDTLPTCV